MRIFKKFITWVRISDLDIYCPVCGKPDWCRISKSGEYVLCSRVPEYKQSGTFHKIDKKIKFKEITNNAGYYPTVNWYALNKSYTGNCNFWRLNQFAALKGVSAQSLLRLETGFDGEAYTFPFRDENFNIVGIQRQFSNSDKIMVRGSKLGIFIPTTYQEDRSPLVITEGVSDCAAALDLGYNAIGRLNCSSGNEIIKKIIKKMVNKSNFMTYIISDCDIHHAGQDGAMRLANELAGIKVKVKVILPPLEYKDLRNWKRLGGLTINQFNEIVKRLPIL